MNTEELMNELRKALDERTAYRNTLSVYKAALTAIAEIEPSCWTEDNSRTAVAIAKKALHETKHETKAPPAMPKPTPVTPEPKYVVKLLGRKAQAEPIKAIKLLREVTGRYLKDAKDIIEGPMPYVIRKLSTGEALLEGTANSIAIRFRDCNYSCVVEKV